MPSSSSPFLTPNAHSTPDSLAILYLRRDHHLPIILRTHDSANEGYAEGKVTNTRFGSFPHSTLIGIPWGTQIRASEVDTGSRGRKGHVGVGKKRKRDEGEGEGALEKKPKVIDKEGDQLGQELEKKEGKQELKAAVAARTGFVHLLPPTPELWTASLPHRTQVVYTPDYSYILQQLRVRPGSVIIEAGAGSGSFTHAAARAVFDGYPSTSTSESGTQTSNGDPKLLEEQAKRRIGKVYSYEFHQSRWEKLKAEISEHGLDGIVEINHRDVCQDGFMISSKEEDDISPNANAIFLDLPAPWLALKHLTRRIRRRSPSKDSPLAPATVPLTHTHSSTTEPISSGAQLSETLPPSPPPATSPLNPSTAIHICTFSPCIEQVQRTISVLRQHGWVSISMAELSHRRVEIQRQRVGLHEEGLRGVNPLPANVDEAIARLREVEGRSRHFHNLEKRRKEQDAATGPNTTTVERAEEGGKEKKEEHEEEAEDKPPTKQERLAQIKAREKERKIWKEGRIVHRAEPDLKTHTSYLVFAVLPREWSEEDERRAQECWGGSSPNTQTPATGKAEMSKHQRRQARRAGKATETGEGAE